jgi:sugar-specific transcriptional regulator TrmB
MNQAQNITIIKNAGLSEKGALVYATLLELGGAFPSQIAKTTGIKRSTVYEVLDDLAIKGLVSELSKRNKFFYSIEHPKRLLHLSERAIIRAQDDFQKLQEYFPNLEGQYGGIMDKPKVSYFEGFDGVMEIYEDHVSGKEPYEMVGFVNIAEIMQFLPAKRYREYVKIKERLGITSRGIIPDTPEDRAHEHTAYKSVPKRILPQIRSIPSKDFPWKGDITIYGSNKVSIITFDGQRVTGIIIENITIHKMMRMIFELAWKGYE